MASIARFSGRLALAIAFVALSASAALASPITNDCHPPATGPLDRDLDATIGATISGVSDTFHCHGLLPLGGELDVVLHAQEILSSALFPPDDWPTVTVDGTAHFGRGQLGLRLTGIVDKGSGGVCIGSGCGGVATFSAFGDLSLQQTDFITLSPTPSHAIDTTVPLVFHLVTDFSVTGAPGCSSTFPVRVTSFISTFAPGTGSDFRRIDCAGSADLAMIATVGRPFSLSLTLEGLILSRGEIDFLDLNALHTTRAFLTTPADVTYTTLSGFRYDAPQAADPVPEPASIFLMGSGILGLAAAARRRKGSNSR